MSLHPIIVPKWGLAMEEGTVSGWLVREGATITAGEEIAEIETSKIANVLEAAASGTLRRIVASEGEVRPVGALIGVIADGDEEDAAIDAFVADYEQRFASEAETGPSAPSPETVTVDGQGTRILVVGDDDNKIPAVLIHGFGGDLDNWMFNQSEWATGRRTISVELPGHGQSDKNVGDGSLQTLARRVIAVMDHRGIESAHLVGHSMGAAVALTIARLAPGKVASLSAVCGVGFGGTVNRDYVEGFVGAQKRKDMKPFAEMLFADPALVTRELVDALVDYKRLDGVPEALRTVADNALGATSIAELEAATAGLNLPVLALFGAEDRIVPTPGAPAAHTITGAGHMAHMEKAETVNARIADFMTSNDR